MNTTNITTQITAFRALSTEAAITPENLGVILQALADLLSAAATNTDLQSLTAWKANLLKLSTLLQSISLGTVGTDRVCLSVIQGNTASGVLQRQADNIILKAATTAQAGVMSAAQVQSLTSCTEDMARAKLAISNCNTNIASLKSWKTKLSEAKQVIQHFKLGDVNKVSVAFSATLLNMVTGELKSINNAFALPAATSSSAGVMTAAQVQQLNKYYDHVCTIDKAVSAVTDTIATSLAYTGSSRVLAASNAAGTQLFSVTLPMATASVPGLTTTRAVTDVQKALNTRVKELGNFLEETAALNALRDPSISGNAEIVVAHLTYQKHMSITLIQNIENDYCRQIIFNHAKVFQRAIYFTGSDRKTISYAEDWGCLFPDRMAWDVNTNKYVLSQFGMKFNALYTDAIPLASATTDGLMSKEDKKTLDATSTDLVNLYNMIMTLAERVDDLENKMKTVQTKLNA